MAKAQKGTKNTEKEGEGLPVEGARAVRRPGGPAGKVASAAGAGHSAQPTDAPPAQRRGKLEKKNKSRLPRRQKKEEKKKAEAASRQPSGSRL
jgi:hypothetical protein